MATPTLTKHSLAGALGPILVDVRAGGRKIPRPAVVIVHGFKGFKDWGMFPRFADRLALAGFTAVSFNVSGSGVDDSGEFSLPDRFGHNTFSAELHDLGRVIEALLAGELDTAPPASLGLVGHSRGGGVAILQAGRDQRIRALVTWAAISGVDRWSVDQRAAWRATGRTEIQNARTGQVLPLYTDVLDDIEHNAEVLDIEAAAGRMRVPWLIIHGRKDESVGFAEAESLRAASSQPNTRLLAIESGGHTFGASHPWKSATPELDTVFDASLAWLAAHLG
ncbi:MAG TPA: alpha/beta fold hydrolase [Gemmatimonadales bacterium]|nr:alpha/beta fold hydrolase [Gemmatimonadales bacterium]